MLEVEIFGADLVPDAPLPARVRRLCALATAAAGVKDGHLAIEYVDAQRIAQLNAEHRGKAGPTDVLSFPIDGAPAHEGATRREAAGPTGSDGNPEIAHTGVAHTGVAHTGFAHTGDSARTHGVERELGDVVICPEHTSDLREAIVHGVLHLVGFDHETDNGEMLALQAELLGDRGPVDRRSAGSEVDP